jgi:DNA excision repair protein ERCC-3
MNPDNPLIVQSDHTILVEVASPRYAEARDALLSFAELVKSPEHVHTYRITPLSIWNACAAGQVADAMIDALREYAKYPVPQQVEISVRDFAGRYGRVRLPQGPAGLRLECEDPRSHREGMRASGSTRIVTHATTRNPLSQRPRHAAPRPRGAALHGI